MAFERRFRGALEITAKEFRQALDRYEPTTGNKTYPERMFSYYYIRAIAKALPRANVLLELPITSKHGHRQDNHIDALIFNDRMVVAAEFKRGWAPSHWRDLAKDLERFGGRIADEIRSGFRRRRPRHAFILLGSDCWKLKHAKEWTAGTRSGRWNFPRTEFEHRDYLRVYKDKGRDYDGYYFTWAVIPFDELST